MKNSNSDFEITPYDGPHIPGSFVKILKCEKVGIFEQNGDGYFYI